MMRFRQGGLAAAIMASTVAGCMAVSVVLAPTPVTLATGTPGGIYHPVGNAICRMFNLAGEHQARPCVAVSSDGSVANIRRVESGESTFGLSQTDIAYAAFHGEGPFAATGPDPKLRMLIALYPEAFTVVARADTGIRDFQDLRGKRIGIGKSGAGYTFTRDIVLGSYGWTIADPDRVLELGPADQNQALCGNKVDAIIFEAGHPNGLTQEATTGCRAQAGARRRPADRPAAGGASLLHRLGHPRRHVRRQSRRCADDRHAGRARHIERSAGCAGLCHGQGGVREFRRFPALASGARRTLTIKDMVPSEAVMPIHPGALEYYREAGLLR